MTTDWHEHRQTNGCGHRRGLAMTVWENGRWGKMAAKQKTKEQPVTLMCHQLCGQSSMSTTIEQIFLCMWIHVWEYWECLPLLHHKTDLDLQCPRPRLYMVQTPNTYRFRWRRACPTKRAGSWLKRDRINIFSTRIFLANHKNGVYTGTNLTSRTSSFKIFK